VLCQRGTNSFAEKVANVQSSGGAAAVIYNNVSGGFAGTLNGSSTIPAISISMEDGGSLKTGALGTAASVNNVGGTGNGYAYYDGTSMATPHVSGVAALVWSYVPTKTNAQIRTALQTTAEDLGPAGRDNAYGYGLVRAQNALAYLGGGGPPPNNPPAANFTYSCTGLTCNFTDTSTDSDGTIASRSWDFGDSSPISTAQNPSHTYAAGTYNVKLTVQDNGGASNSTTKSVTVTAPPPSGITLSAVGSKVKGVNTVALSWTVTGTVGTTFDVFRNSSLRATVGTKSYTDSTGSKGAATYTYQVCDKLTPSTCSNTVTVVF
jgi:PKD repeat protein